MSDASEGPPEPNPPDSVKQPTRPKLLQVLGPGLITGAQHLQQLGPRRLFD